MAKVVKHERCPSCAVRGLDNRGDNLAIYSDGGSHCFSCGRHRVATSFTHWIKKDETEQSEEGSLPRDFTRDVPAEGWKWLLQWGLPYSYWKPYTGYSPAENRLILTVGSTDTGPIIYSQGRYLGIRRDDEGLGAINSSSGRKARGMGSSEGFIQGTYQHREALGRITGAGERVLVQTGTASEAAAQESSINALRMSSQTKKVLPVRVPAKWRGYGKRQGLVSILEHPDSSETEIVLVEDLISQHKVRQITACACLFGTHLSDELVKKLVALQRPVAVWLDRDQYTLLAPKLNRLQTFLVASVRHISTEKDPKAYSLTEIQEILK